MPQDRSPKPSRRQRRRVRFERSETGDGVKTSEIAAPHRQLFSDAQRLWWQREDFERIRLEASKVTEDIRLGDVLWADARKYSYSKCLSKLYRCSNKKNAELSSQVKDDFFFWILVGHSRRGLERFVMDDLRKDREQKRCDAFETVLVEQDKCEERHLSIEETERIIHAAYEKQSRGAKKFAELMGEADAHAARVSYKERGKSKPKRRGSLSPSPMNVQSNSASSALRARFSKGRPPTPDLTKLTLSPAGKRSKLPSLPLSGPVRIRRLSPMRPRTGAAA